MLATAWITPVAGLLLGVSLVRANSCTVASTRRLVIERRADWLLGLLVAISWAGFVLLGFAFLTPINLRFPTDVPITMSLVTGSILLGVGALLNKGCFLGSVSQLCRGNLNYLLTLTGITLALSTYSHAPDTVDLARGRYAAEAITAVHLTWYGCLAALLFCVMIAFSLIKLHRRRTITMMALIMVGISGGFIYSFNPDWSYTSMLDRAVHGNLTVRSWPLEVGAASMFVGAIFSSILGSKFTIIRPSFLVSTGCLLGGFLMGLGAKMIPGGNDTMMLWSIPGLAGHGLAAYLIMILTIASGFGLLSLVRPRKQNVCQKQDA